MEAGDEVPAAGEDGADLSAGGKECAEVIVGGVVKSGGHFGGGMVSVVRWGPRLTSDESLESAKVVVEVLDPFFAATGIVVTAVVAVVFPTPPELRGFIGKSNAFSNSGPQNAVVADLAEGVVTGEIPAAKRRAAACSRAFLCMMCSPVRSSLDSGLNFINFRSSVHRVFLASCSALAA